MQKSYEQQEQVIKNTVLMALLMLHVDKYIFTWKGKRYSVTQMPPTKRIHIPANDDVLALLASHGVNYEVIDIKGYIKFQQES